MLKAIQLVRDRTPGVGNKSDQLVTNLLPTNFGRWWQDSSSYHADLDMHMARLMRAAVSGG